MVGQLILVLQITCKLYIDKQCFVEQSTSWKKHYNRYWTWFTYTLSFFLSEMMHMDQWSWILLSSSLATFGAIYFFWNVAGTYSFFQVELQLPCFGVYRMIILERFLNLSVWCILVARSCTICKTSLIWLWFNLEKYISYSRIGILSYS